MLRESITLLFRREDCSLNRTGFRVNVHNFYAPSVHYVDMQAFDKSRAVKGCKDYDIGIRERSSEYLCFLKRAQAAIISYLPERLFGQWQFLNLRIEIRAEGFDL